MTNTNQNHDTQAQVNPAEENDTRRKHDTPGWARKYLDLADTAFGGGNSEEPTQR